MLILKCPCFSFSCDCFDCACFWAGVTAFFTLLLVLGTFLLVYVGWKQLKAINKTNEADFFHKIKVDFYNQVAQELLFLFDRAALFFVKPMDIKEPFYAVDTRQLNEIEIELFKKISKSQELPKFYSLEEVETYLLNELEDLFVYKKKGVMSIEDISDGYDVYFEIAVNDETQKHIDFLRERFGDKEIYNGIKTLYNDLKARKNI
jgi:hypothetical protein